MFVNIINIYIYFFTPLRIYNNNKLIKKREKNKILVY